MRYNLGHSYDVLGRLDGAAAAYRAAIGAKPTYRDAHDSLNRLLWQRGDTAHYLRSYLEALRDDPDDADLLADLANRLNLGGRIGDAVRLLRSEEHTSELQSLMRNSYAVFCLKKKK